MTALSPEIDDSDTGAEAEPTEGGHSDQQGPSTGAKVGGFLRSQIAVILAPIALLAAFGLLMNSVDNQVYSVPRDQLGTERAALLWGPLRAQTIQHIKLTGISTAIVLVIAIPLGIVLTRKALRRIGSPMLAVANAGQAVPVYGLFVIFFAWFGGVEQGDKTAIAALAVYTVLPVLRNTMVGLDQVDPDLIEASRGMGMTRLGVLTRVELPLAVPVILAGVRIALVINVGTAALAYLIGAGGLGVIIGSGLANQNNYVLLVGAAMTALLALTIDWLAAVVERVLRPRGL